MTHANILFDRDGGDYLLTVNWLGAGPDVILQDPTGVTGPSAVTVEVLDPIASTPATQIVPPTPMVWDSAIKLWKLSRPVADLAGRRYLCFRFVPTVHPDMGPLVFAFGKVAAIADALKRQDEIEAKVGGPTDTNGTITTGSLAAKSNKILENQNNGSPGAIEFFGTEPVG